MTWALLGMKLMGIGRAIGAWLAKRSLAELACIALALFAGLQTIRVAAEKRHSAKVEAQLLKCDQQRHADQEAYAKAQADAQAANRAHVEQIEQQYQRNSDDERQAYLRDHAELVRLRQHPTAQGAASGAGSPAAPAPTQGADGDGLRLSPDEHLQAQEIELRLMHLQNWVERQLGVDPNKP